MKALSKKKHKLDSLCDYKVEFGFNWIAKLTFSYMFYVVVADAIDPNGSGRKGLILLLIFFGIFVIMECTPTGYRRRYKLFFLSFYFKKHTRWEEISDLSICNLLFLSNISIFNFPLFRCLFYNYDELAELISRNKRIKERTRQQFLDYVNARKKQSRISKILPTIIYSAIFFIIVAKVEFGI